MVNTKDKNYTYADYKKWNLTESEHYELINGEAFPKPKLSDDNKLILDRLYKQLSDFLEGKSIKAFCAPFNVRLFYKPDESDNTVFQPDITIICDPKIWVPEGCHGAPDFICEIISPAVTAVEFERKFQSYHTAGVREYWVINPEYKTLNIYNFWDDIIFPIYHCSTDTVKIGIFEDLDIKLETVWQ